MVAIGKYSAVEGAFVQWVRPMLTATQNRNSARDAVTAEPAAQPLPEPTADQLDWQENQHPTHASTMATQALWLVTTLLTAAVAASTFFVFHHWHFHN